MNIFFDKSLKWDFMAAQKLSSDDGGYVIDADTQERVKNDEGNYIKTKEFGGIRRGSRIFLKADISTVIREASMDNKASGRTR